MCVSGVVESTVFICHLSRAVCCVLGEVRYNIMCVSGVVESTVFICHLSSAVCCVL